MFGADLPPLPWSPAQAIAWLEGEHDHPHENYHMECAHLAARSRGFDSSGMNAAAWGHQIPFGLRHHGTGCAKGGMYWWITNGDTNNPTPYGHVANSYGQERVICNDDRGNVSVMPVSFFRGLGDPIWLPPELLVGLAPAFSHCGGRNPFGPPPGPSPAPAPPGPGGVWPLTPGKDYPHKMPELKAAFGWGNVTASYGAPFAERVKKWQAHHPAFGAANGLIGPKTYHAITGK